MLAFAVALTSGCGGGGDAGEEGGEAAAPGGEVAAVAVENPGTITGSVAFTGTAPAPAPIDMRAEATCAEKHTTPPTQQTVVVNGNGTLRNVFVWVREGVTAQHPTPSTQVEINQDGCEYIPHVLGLQTGQTLIIRNSDAVLHNINTRPEQNRGFNISQPQAGMTSERTFPTPEVMIPVQCDVHGWMQAYIGVVDHPYFAVSGDDGSFSIGNLPPGDYVLEAWHEQYGTQTLNVTVPPNGTVEAPFSYSATTAMTPVSNGAVDHSAHAGHSDAGVD
jgi:hypothetical protein